MLEDKLLMWRLKRGDRDVLRVVYEKYKDSLRTIAGAMLRDSHAGEDVLHDVFVVFAENVAGLGIRVSLRNYLPAAQNLRGQPKRKQYQQNGQQQ